ncbi:MULTISPECIES: DUF4190 domain-containing protein [Subtercola]|uniref:DUF4190 domain-containing protein n=1 Tax=Subtercola vilae TaxID=2056433 RepID=A0A4T2BS83_9MICO|nr:MULTISPECIES: DUF4190 domain-containing protein [Subtercola]MEA9986845.1 DUF4190 domain-containing protein [Subtercola sp. RTI3]TIH34337.1 DUF4190 domain-containing protein [Subtercola vilae]
MSDPNPIPPVQHPAGAEPSQPAEYPPPGQYPPKSQPTFEPGQYPPPLISSAPPAPPTQHPANPYASTSTPAAAPYGYGAGSSASAQPGTASTNVLAIIALVLGFVVPIGGIVTGHIALSQIKKSGESGRGLALAGTIMGYAFTGLAILGVIAYIVFIVILFSTAGHTSGYTSKY